MRIPRIALAVTLVACGPTTGVAQSGSMTAVAFVSDLAVSIAAAAPLRFGTVIPGTPVTIDPNTSPNAGKFEIRGARRAEFTLDMVLPTQLVAGPGNAMPVSFGAASGCGFTQDDQTRCSTFDPSVTYTARIRATPAPNNTHYVWLGGGGHAVRRARAGIVPGDGDGVRRVYGQRVTGRRLRFPAFAFVLLSSCLYSGPSLESAQDELPQTGLPPMTSLASTALGPVSAAGFGRSDTVDALLPERRASAGVGPAPAEERPRGFGAPDTLTTGGGLTFVVPQDTTTVELLLEVRIDRGPSGDVVTLLRGERVLLSAAALLRLTGIDAAASSDGRRLEGVVQPAGRTFSVLAEFRTVRIDERVVSVDRDDLATVDGTLFLRDRILEEILDVSLRLSAADQIVSMLGADHLPAVRRFARERRWERARRERETLDGLASLVTERRFFDGAVLDWEVSSATQRPFGASGFGLGFGAQVAGGSGVVQFEQRGTESGTYRRATGSWTRVFPTRRWIRQIRLGEVLGTGPNLRVVRGAAITNSPFVRPSGFAFERLFGTLGAGWDVELYRNDRLIDFTPVGQDGRFEFEVPVLYGENPVELVGYGPSGETVRLRRTFDIASERFPRGQFEYGAAVGACQPGVCRASANLDLRYGLTDRLTVRGGLERLWRDSVADLWHPYGAAIYQASRAIGLFGEAVGNALVRGRVEVAPSQDLRASLQHTQFVGSVEAPVIGSALDDSRTELSLFVRPGLMDYRLHGDLRLVRASGAMRTREAARLTTTMRFDGIRVDAGMLAQRSRVLTAPMRSSFQVLGRYFQSFHGPDWLRNTVVRSQVRFDVDSGPVGAAVGVSRLVTPRVQVEAGASWTRGLRGVSLDIGITANMRAFRATSRNRYMTDEGVRGTQMIEGSLLWDREGGQVTFEDGRSVGRSGIAGHVFFDENENGHRDPNERPARNVRIRVGSRAARSGDDGSFVVWDFVPFEQLVVEVDGASVDDALWIPALPRFAFRPQPNTFTPVPIPLVRGWRDYGIGAAGADCAADRRRVGHAAESRYRRPLRPRDVCGRDLLLSGPAPRPLHGGSRAGRSHDVGTRGRGRVVHHRRQWSGVPRRRTGGDGSSRLLAMYPTTVSASEMAHHPPRKASTRTRVPGRRTPTTVAFRSRAARTFAHSFVHRVTPADARTGSVRAGAAAAAGPGATRGISGVGSGSDAGSPGSDSRATDVIAVGGAVVSVAGGDVGAGGRSSPGTTRKNSATAIATRPADPTCLMRRHRAAAYPQCGHSRDPRTTSPSHRRHGSSSLRLPTDPGSGVRRTLHEGQREATLRT